MQRVLLSGRRISFSSFADFSFRDKWSGIYSLDEKVANYIAVKTEFGWAAPENAKKVVLDKKGRSATYHHRINGADVSITVSITQKARESRILDFLEVSVGGASSCALEIGFCERHAYASECNGAKTHMGFVIGKRHVVSVENEEGTIITPENTAEIVQTVGNETYNILRATYPFKGKIRISVRERVPRRVTFTPSREATFRTDNRVWDDVYEAAKRTISILTKRRGWYAGLPWFVQYWARDTYISVPALIREGHAQLVRRTLLDFLYSKVDGEIPKLIREDGTPEFGSIDANPLFLNALADYVLITRDYGIIADNKQDILEVVDWMFTEFDEGLPKSRGKDTWMDTLEIRKYPVEVLAYELEAIRKLEAMGLLQDIYRPMREVATAELKKYMLERSANILLASVYRLIPPELAIKRAKEWRLITDSGVRTWSPLEAEYDPREYHTGAVWGLTTAAGLYVAIEAREWDVANALLNALASRTKYTYYLDEVWDANTGEPLGADAQLWSAAMVIRAIDEVMIDRRIIPLDIGTIRRTRLEKDTTKQVNIHRVTTKTR